MIRNVGTGVKVRLRSYYKAEKYLNIFVRYLSGNVNTKSGDDQRLSYFHYLGRQRLEYRTVGDVLENAAEKYGGRTALVAAHQNERISFAEVKEKVRE